MEESMKKKTTAYLTQTYGETTNRKFKLTCSKVTIGRNVHSEIRLRNPNISRTHCTLYYTGNGWTITDNKSQNGTYISGRKLKPGETKLLQCGDIIFLGPPSELPEAFSYDDAFVNDETICQSGHEIIELPMKRPTEEKMTASKKKNLVKETTDDVEIEVACVEIASSSIQNGHIKQTVEVLESKEISNSPQCSSKVLNKEEALLHKNETNKNSTLSSELNIENQAAQPVSQDKMSPSVYAPPSKLVKLDETDSGYGYQIHEISSTGVDQAEDSLSLLDLEKIEVIEPCCSGYSEPRQGLICVQDPQTPKETDILKSKLALLSDQIKRLEESKMNLLKNYEIVCEKNFSLDQQLSEKKKLEEDIKTCELKVKDKIKNELLEKFEEDLICNICTELLIKPTVLDCSHTFCLYCIKEWKKKKNECPICRHKIQTMTPVLTLEHFIDKTLSTLTPEQKERRSQLVKEREKQPPQKPTTPTSRRYRNGRRRFRQRSFTSVNRQLAPAPSGDDIEIVGERRNNILPIPLPQLTIPSMYLRIPEMLLDNARDSFSVYLT